MAIFFLTTLCISALALITLLGVKRYELRTGRVAFARIRPRAQRLIQNVILLVQYMLPFLARRSLFALTRGFRLAVGHFVALGVLYVENALRQMLVAIHNILQPKTHVGPASSFLQEVAEHKRKLLRKPVEKRAIFERYQ
jgi:hypothetical protein